VVKTSKGVKFDALIRHRLQPEPLCFRRPNPQAQVPESKRSFLKLVHRRCKGWRTVSNGNERMVIFNVEKYKWGHCRVLKLLLHPPNTRRTEAEVPLTLLVAAACSFSLSPRLGFARSCDQEKSLKFKPNDPL
jgi:hypothetical protein